MRKAARSQSVVNRRHEGAMVFDGRGSIIIICIPYRKHFRLLISIAIDVNEAAGQYRLILNQHF